MESKPEPGTKLIHVLIPAITALLVALIGLGTAIYQSEEPIRLTEVAETALASTLTAGPLLLSLAPVTPSPNNQSLPTPIASAATVALTNTLIPPVTTTAALTNTPIPPIVATLPSSITIQNELVLPVSIAIDSVSKGNIEAGSTKTYLLDSFPVSVDWTLIKETTDTGTPIGVDMGGNFSNVKPGDDVLVIDSVVGDQHYFYPFITNPTNTDCDVVINQGETGEVDPKAVVLANTDDVGMGYYELNQDSNVTLTCGSDIYWWGIRTGDPTEKSIYNQVDPNSGEIDFKVQ